MGKDFKRILSSLIIACILICELGTPIIASAMESDSVEEGYYTLENVYSRKNLNVSGGKSTNGTNINIYKENRKKNQTYKIYKIDLSYALTPTNAATGKLVNVKGDKVKSNANVMLYDKTGKGHSIQRWIFLFHR